MSFVRRKIVGTHSYLEVVKSYRSGGKVKHKYIKSLGPEKNNILSLNKVSPASPLILNATTTFAFGISENVRYEFYLKIVDASVLITSHDPFNFTSNPAYPECLQPRLRNRFANQYQVRHMAANLDPEILLTDFHSLDRGTPIVGTDGVVESGNGRVMAIRLSAKEHPEVYAKYREGLKSTARSHHLAWNLVGKFDTPVLIRERTFEVDRKRFVIECNMSTIMESSPIEQARIDASKLTIDILSTIDVSDSEIANALISPRNKVFMTAFIGNLAEVEQARLLGSQGNLNQEGVRRAVMAIFAAVFRGDNGLKMAELFYESTESNVCNCMHGIARSLGLLAKSETLANNGSRSADYSIGEDLSKAIIELSTIKSTPYMSVEDYLAQTQMLGRKLTPFQEIILYTLDRYSRSPKQIGSIISHYAQSVIDMKSLNQMPFMAFPSPTKEQLFNIAVNRKLGLL